MKRVFLFLLMAGALSCMAAPVFNVRTFKVQPNGDTLWCLLSGDEYYHRLHDAAGYTIVENPQTGQWVYADTVHTGKDRWEVVASRYVAGTVNPAAVGLPVNAGPDYESWTAMQHRYDVPEKWRAESGEWRTSAHGQKTSGRNHGTLNNIVIFIRFNGDAEISTPFSTINSLFNDSTANATSMYNYFKKASYGKIYIPSHYFPTPNGNSVVSYEDIHPRSYYMPYSSSNTNGYTNDNDKREREFSLLERAVNYINENYPVPTSLNLDMDGDGLIDNVCFIVTGTFTGWNDLLWPHKWSLYDRQVYINNKRVYTFNFQLEGSGEHYFSASTFCHEMFHTLSAPDLYRYNTMTSVSCVGGWDLMGSNSQPPQHMGAYMKWKYGNWLDSIPTIRQSGTYTLHSLADADYSNCVYKIAAQEEHQWYVFEYRDDRELFETGLPGRGLLIYRIDDRFDGNADYDGENNFDEVYLFRPGAANAHTNGNLSRAHFSSNVGRTAFTPTTNPHPWLTGVVLDTTISITNITSPGETISFTYSDLRGCQLPTMLAADSVGGSAARLTWTGNSGSYNLQWREAGSQTVNTVVLTDRRHTLTGLTLNTSYEWRVQGVCSDDDNSDYTSWVSFHTDACEGAETAEVGNASNQYYTLPMNTIYKYSYSQMIYSSAEVGEAKEITKIAFRYAGSSTITVKDNCTIYMGNTSQMAFNGVQVDNFVPYEQLQQVYQGPIECTQGWNEIALDTPFLYDGASNLVVAIDDNSGEAGSTEHTFHCTSTGIRHTSLSYYGDDENPDPASTTAYGGTKSRRQYHPDIRFGGCPVDFTLTVASSDLSLGTVSEGGTYRGGTTVTVTATPIEHYRLAYWQAGDAVVEGNPYSFALSRDTNFIAHFALEQHNITVNLTEGGTVEGDGLHDYGSTATLTATPDAQHLFDHWYDPSADEEYTANPYSFTVDGDRTLEAHFAVDPSAGIDETEEIKLSVETCGLTVKIEWNAEGSTDTPVGIYDITGRQLCTSPLSPFTFHLPTPGIYLLRYGNHSPLKIVAY